MANSMQLFGDKELQKRLEQLAPKLEKKALRRGVTKGMRQVAKLAKSNAPRETGTLKRSIGQKIKTVRGSVYGIVGPRKGFKTAVTVSKRGKKKRLTKSAEAKGGTATEYRDPIRYAHLVEFGSRSKSGRPFLRPAFDASVDSVLGTIKSELRSEVNKAGHA